MVQMVALHGLDAPTQCSGCFYNMTWGPALSGVDAQCESGGERKQGEMPCMMEDGRVIMETPYHIAMAPDGNGGLYTALLRCALLLVQCVGRGKVLVKEGGKGEAPPPCPMRGERKSPSEGGRKRTDVFSRCGK
jgi:hypothetical protein